jgi:hypothetical protein
MIFRAADVALCCPNVPITLDQNLLIHIETMRS